MIFYFKKNITGNQVSVSRNDLSKGMYIFRLSNENKSYFGKFVIKQKIKGIYVSLFRQPYSI